MSFSDYAEQKVMQFWFRTGSPTKPTNLYCGLATASVGESANGSTVTEANYTSYARVQVDPSDSNWSFSAPTISNASTIAFPASTGGTNTVTHFFIADAATAGNIIISGALGVSKSLTAGDTVSFAAGQLTASLD